MMRALGITILVIFGILLGWFFFFPMLGGIIALTAQAWAILITSVIVFCVAVMLVFVITSSGLLILGIGAFVWTLLAIALFPIIFPVLAPLFIILLFLAYIVRRQKRKRSNEQK